MTDIAPAGSDLSNREEEVAAAYAAGQSYKEIARSLGLSPTTVRSHLRAVYGKLRVTSKIELARFLADRTGLEERRDSTAIAAELALELDDAVRRERSLAKLLRIISDRGDQFDAAIDAVLDHALEICEAEFGILFEYEGDLRFREMRSRNIAPAFAEWLAEQTVFEVDPKTGLGRVAREPQTLNIADVRAEEAYRSQAPLRIATADLGKARSFAAIPLMSSGALIGVFTVYRTRVHPFNERALELAQMFADQAVIAIESVRQYNELQARLDREAASREILGVISNSRADEQPVFDVILKNAARLCHAPFAGLFLVDDSGGHVSLVANLGARSEYLERALTRWSMDSDASIPKAIANQHVVHIEDLKDSDAYRTRDPQRVDAVEIEGIRTFLAVPLLHQGRAIGAIGLYLREVGGFGRSQIELVETFAAQAVIAIENVRQFKALEARTKEVQKLNAALEMRVEDQVGEIERMGRLKRFLSPAVADAVITSGDEKMLSSHRSLIATLFCDIRGFTAFCETAEPEETIEVLQTYHEEMSKLIAAHHAGVDKRMGDGIMVILNDPLPCEDPAGDAVRLAIDMRDRMAVLCKKWKKLGHRLGFGVGISLGYATIGMVGSEGRYDYTASGTSVNLAARLCDRAEDGEILLSPRAYIAVEDDFAAESSGEMTLKGIREPVEVFRLLGAQMRSNSGPDAA
ncbi:MAG: GAF domain-containing protein [Pseudomonadota bacterium]